MQVHCHQVIIIINNSVIIIHNNSISIDNIVINIIIIYISNYSLTDWQRCIADNAVHCHYY